MKNIRTIAQPSVPEINAINQVNLRGVITWSSPVVVTVTSTTNGTPLSHDLGVVPTDFNASPWVNGVTWADQNDRRMWTSTSIVFHASATGRYTVMAGVR